MAKRGRHPPSPETWALVMLALLGICAAGMGGIYLLGALTGRQFLGVLLLIGLAAVSVVLRYLTGPRRPD